MPQDYSLYTVYQQLINAKSAEHFALPEDYRVDLMQEEIAQVAFDGHDNAIQLLKESCYGTCFGSAIAQGYARAKRYDLVEQYLNQDNPQILPVIKGLIQAKDYSKVDEYQKKYNVDVGKIAVIYITQEDEHAEAYCQKHQIHIDVMAGAFAELGNHTKVEEYVTLNADVNKIAAGYARAGNDSKVREYQRRFAVVIKTSDYPFIPEFHASYTHQLRIAAIDYYEALAINPQQAQKARAKYVSLIEEVLESNRCPVEDKHDLRKVFASIQASSLNTSNQSTDQSALTDKMMSRLNLNDPVEKELHSAMTRLIYGKNCFWNPYWMNSTKKLDAIVSALAEIPKGQKMADHMTDKNSALYAAINIQRLAPITFLGVFGCNRAKSLIAVEEKIANIDLKQF